jgi:hypothetical protein
VSISKEIGKAFDKFSRGAHPRMKAWHSRMGVGYEAACLILEKIIKLEATTGMPSPNFKVQSAK